MPPIPPQTVQVDCPGCGHRYRSNVYTIADVTQQPELKQALLAGRLNVAVCPQCGYSLLFGAPLLYHDAEKQLYLVFFPQELSMSTEDQERFIGEATNAVISNLPPNAPRGYLLTPHRFMSLMSMIDAILEADGVPREVMEQQRKRVDLIGQLIQVMENEAQLTSLVKQYQDELNYEFFATLSAFIEASSQEGRDDSTQALTQLYQKLVQITGLDMAQMKAPEDAELTQAIDRLIEVSDETLDEAVSELRASIDYGFFQALTARIEAAERAGKSDEAQRLTERRARILTAVEQIDKEVHSMLESRDGMLREVLAAADPKAALHALGEHLDEGFMTVLSLNIATLQQAGNQAEAVARLEQIRDLTIEVIQERLPPDERFINELLLKDTVEESIALLRQNAAMVTTEFVKKLNELAAEQEQRGIQQTAERLRRLAREASPMLF